ncbi:DYW_deaminase domain-containing protein [Psidium guajava]|nr:DYW_deaminase domain-containing protein [Psidium guajava]
MAVEASGQLAQGGYGRPLVEVFSVVLRLNKPSGKVYGTITVDDGMRRQYIYNRKRDGAGSGSAALLNGPAGGISALDNFYIDVDLMDDIKGLISWNVNKVTNVCDRLLEKKFNGQTGSAIVNYAVFDDAAEAIVEVMLLNGDGNDPAHVYGQITARNTNFTNESTLFRKTVDEKRRVSPGEHIPLSRSVVAVPLSSSLMVGANLFVHNGYKRESKTEIAKGTAEFPAQCYGTFERDIWDKYGMIRVKVTWTLDI